jgi:hypothetical protein
MLCVGQRAYGHSDYDARAFSRSIVEIASKTRIFHRLFRGSQPQEREPVYASNQFVRKEIVSVKILYLTGDSGRERLHVESSDRLNATTVPLDPIPMIFFTNTNGRQNAQSGNDNSPRFLKVHVASPRRGINRGVLSL